MILKSYLNIKRKILKKGIIIGLPIYVIIVVAYLLTKNFIDFSNVAPNLTNTMEITKNSSFLVALYIPFLNLFQEEFFLEDMILFH